jgi:hypothetical protein
MGRLASELSGGLPSLNNLRAGPSRLTNDPRPHKAVFLLEIKE